MQYIKAKYMKQENPIGRAYTFKIYEDVKPGDIVEDTKGSHLIIVDDPVDEEWIQTYGIEKIALVKKYIEPNVAESEE